jgi:outer membrane protein TolC
MNHDLKATRYNEDIARAEARSAQAENAPRVNVIASVSGVSDSGYNGGRNYEAQVGARLIMPFWSAGQPQSRARAALSEANAARFEALGQERVLEEQVTQAWAALEAARNASTISAELARAAQVARTGAELEFDVGLRSIIEVLNQEQELQDARVNLATSRSNLMVALSNIYILIGLDPTGIINSTTEFDPSRMVTSLAGRRPGQLARWERPLVGVFDVVNEAQKATKPIVKDVTRAIFGPEQ